MELKNKNRFLAKENTQLQQKIQVPENSSKEKDQLLNWLIESFIKQKQIHTVKQNSWHTEVKKNHQNQNII